MDLIFCAGSQVCECVRKTGVKYSETRQCWTQDTNSIVIQFNICSVNLRKRNIMGTGEKKLLQSMSYYSLLQ